MNELDMVVIPVLALTVYGVGYFFSIKKKNKKNVGFGNTLFYDAPLSETYRRSSEIRPPTEFVRSSGGRKTKKIKR
jgi:hypothetical protein